MLEPFGVIKSIMTASSTPATQIDFGRATLSQALYKALEKITDFELPGFHHTQPVLQCSGTSTRSASR